MAISARADRRSKRFPHNAFRTPTTSLQPLARLPQPGARTCRAPMSTSEDDDDFGSDPFGLRELYRNNSGLSSNAFVAAVASPGASASSAIASVVAPTASSVNDDEACQRSFPPLSDKSMSAWARSAAMPKHCEIVRTGRWQHKAYLHGPLEQLVVSCQASIADDPVHIVQPIGQEQTVTQITAKLLGVIDACAASGAAKVAFGKKACVYVGACVDVKYRWHGTTREELDEWRGSGVSLAERRRRFYSCLLYTSPSPRDGLLSRMPSSA